MKGSSQVLGWVAGWWWKLSLERRLLKKIRVHEFGVGQSEESPSWTRREVMWAGRSTVLELRGEV